MSDDSFDAPTYNDIMLQHREQTVKRWKDLRTTEQTEEQVTEAVRGIFNAIEALYEAAERASDYVSLYVFSSMTERFTIDAVLLSFRTMMVC